MFYLFMHILYIVTFISCTLCNKLCTTSETHFALLDNQHSINQLLIEHKTC